jgi:hypothetical protein
MSEHVTTDIVELIDTVESMAADLLSQKARQTEDIEEKFFYFAVRSAAANAIGIYEDVSVEEIPVENIVKKLQQRFSTKMSLGTMFAAKEYKPWLEQASGDMDWYYWERYRKFLLKSKFPPHVVRSLGGITDQILDHTENPKKPGQWDRRGLVVGHVQSGKTANYTGLICKAADSGYRVIIVLAGMLNSLRSQTQERIDQGFIGRCTRQKELIGVCEDQVPYGNPIRNPAYFTTVTDDFKKKIANQIGVGIGDLREPVVLVVKKNTSTLKNLISWLKDNNPHNLQEYPMLLIDDEADQASVNTKKDGITAINGKIRELLGLFSQSSYIGYTATPFANIFIDPDDEDAMLGDNLFPRDFILSLDPPDNYVGPDRIFATGGDLKIVRNVYDYEDLIPLKHDKALRPEDLPNSLKRAIQAFILVKAIRLLRGQNRAHNSMMVNVSRFTDVQSHIKDLVDDYLKSVLRPAISNHSMLDQNEALKNSVIQEFYEVWDEEFNASGYPWNRVQEKLHEAISPIRVIEVNSSSNSEALDYTKENFPSGRSVIAVGGMSLSRGLTLEGLTVSYFLRNSIMYDTLLQMGRWFGYRDEYADLCRIFMTEDASGWYSHIADVINELRAEFRVMKQNKLTPDEFGLCVRAHPESLIVTARNKMRSGKLLARKIDLEGRLVETKALFADPKKVEHNLNALNLLIGVIRQSKCFEEEQLGGASHFWKSVPCGVVKSFLEGVQNHPGSELTERVPLLEYASWMAENGWPDWDVALCGVSEGKAKIEEPYVVEDLSVVHQFRSVEKRGQTLLFRNRRVATVGTEQIGLEKWQLEQARAETETKSITDATYRRIRNKPLLMLHLLDCHEQDVEASLFSQGILAWGLSFPGQAGTSRPKKLVEYVVNTRYWQQEYGDEVEDEADLGDEYE